MTPDRYEPSGGFQDSPQTCKASEASETVWGCGMDPNKLHSLPSRSLAEAEVWNFLGLARLLLLLALLLLSLSLSLCRFLRPSFGLSRGLSANSRPFRSASLGKKLRALGLLMMTCNSPFDKSNKSYRRLSDSPTPTIKLQANPSNGLKVAKNCSTFFHLAAQRSCNLAACEAY